MKELADADADSNRSRSGHGTPPQSSRPRPRRSILPPAIPRGTASTPLETGGLSDGLAGTEVAHAIQELEGRESHRVGQDRPQLGGDP